MLVKILLTIIIGFSALNLITAKRGLSYSLFFISDFLAILLYSLFLKLFFFLREYALMLISVNQKNNITFFMEKRKL